MCKECEQEQMIKSLTSYSATSLGTLEASDLTIEPFDNEDTRSTPEALSNGVSAMPQTINQNWEVGEKVPEYVGTQPVFTAKSKEAEPEETKSKFDWAKWLPIILIGFGVLLSIISLIKKRK
jgi:hypothetical protein